MSTLPALGPRVIRTLVTTVALGLTLAADPTMGRAIGAEGGHRTPVEVNGRLRVCGTHLCNAYGRPVQLRGMSTHGTQWYARCLVGGALDAIAYDWRASVLRVATYAREGGYSSDPEKFTELASDLIDRASRRGMYVIVDWHMVNPGNPNFDVQKALAFFKEIAKRHRDQPNVLYEIANEPNNVDWSTIKAFAQKVIPVIRAEAPHSVILVGTRSWSTLGASDHDDEQEVVDNPVNAANIMYTYHFYAAVHRDRYLATLDRASSKLPLFVSEWGTQSWKGFGNDFAMAQKFVDLMARKKIGWTNWALADGSHDGDVFETGACGRGEFTGTEVLKPAGVWIRERIRERIPWRRPVA